MYWRPKNRKSDFNQFTGGTNTINSLYYPVRTASAIAKGRLLEAAATELALWFDPAELLDYERDVDRWVLAPAE